MVLDQQASQIETDRVFVRERMECRHALRPYCLNARHDSLIEQIESVEPIGRIAYYQARLRSFGGADWNWISRTSAATSASAAPRSQKRRCMGLTR